MKCIYIYIYMYIYIHVYTYIYYIYVNIYIYIYIYCMIMYVFIYHVCVFMCVRSTYRLTDVFGDCVSIATSRFPKALFSPPSSLSPPRYTDVLCML